MFTPKLWSALREGYGLSQLRADALAGLTVAIVALPLSMAIAIGAGARPETGLYAAIVGGFFISALGGSRFQIGGPAGAFIVVMAAALREHGMDGLLLATMIAGAMQIAIGRLRLGAYVRYVPHPVTVGFTAGIALIIFLSQIGELTGIKLEREPAPPFEKLAALWEARALLSPATLAMSLLCVAVVTGLRLWRPRFPGFLAAVALAAGLTNALDLPLATIASRFGGLPRGLPWPQLPALSLEAVAAVLPAAFTFAMLGSIESLLSAVVADGMSGRRHRPNCELVAQGVANIASALFGGLCATGAIARTATNVRAHASGPVAGMLHAIFLFAFLAIAAPLAGAIPLCALSAVLACVCWNMADKREFVAILRQDRAEALVLLATFLITVFHGLTEGIAVGVTLGALIFMHRMASLVTVATAAPADTDDAAPDGADDFALIRIEGPFFFGAASEVGLAFDRVSEAPSGYILDLARAPLIDATAAQTLRGFVDRAAKNGRPVCICGASPAVRAVIAHAHLGARIMFARDIDAARMLLRAKTPLAEASPTP